MHLLQSSLMMGEGNFVANTIFPMKLHNGTIYNVPIVVDSLVGSIESDMDIKAT